MSVVLIVGCAAAVACVGGLWWARRLFVVVHVSGMSMWPTYRSGDRVLVRRTGPRGTRRGDVVVLRDPQRPSGRLGRSRWVIKRATTVTADHRIGLAGDNAAYSTDSRHYGLVRADTVLGTVVCRL